jgi:glucose/arabinose dehydrogenase
MKSLRRTRPCFAESLEPRTLLSVPSGFAQSTWVDGLSQPTGMAFAPDGRLFVCEQGGALRVVSAAGQLLSTPFLTVPARNVEEQGLLSVAFDPNFGSNHFVYVSWINSSRANQVSRFTADGSNPDVAASGSGVLLFDGPVNAGNNHNGGALVFGGDGKLYLSMGERGDPPQAQSLSNPFGKVLRLNSDGTIPTDNPFYGQTTGVSRAIWAYGLRNPFSMAVQPGTGRLFINDVGQSSFEEVNEGAAGRNFGWPTTEGPFNASQFPQFTNPLFANGGFPTRSIAGGTFYNPQTSQFPSSYVGDYFVGDYVGGLIQHVDLSGATPQVSIFATQDSVPKHVDLDLGPDGALYALARGNESAGGGFVARIAYNASGAPVIGTQPQSQTVTVGRPVTFTVSASGTGTLSYQWQRNGSNIAGATATSYTIGATQAGDNGATFRCVVSNASGTATSNAATLTVTANQAPTATINTPAAGSLYTAGQTLSFTGSGTDPEDGALSASAFTWTVVLHHDTHTHPAMPATSGSTSGSYAIPTVGETSANVWYRIHLTVTDAQGLSASTFRDVSPRTAQITLATVPTGLSVNLDGAPRTGPYSVTGVQGVTRSLGAPDRQTVGGTTYEFVSWSDAGARDHNVTTPTSNTTYTATFRVVDTSVPTVTSQPHSVGVPVGSPATFSVTAAGAAPLSYQWQRDGVDIDAATSADYTLPSAQLSDNGATFRCVVTNANGTATSNAATLTVANGSAPVAVFTAPAAGAPFRGGDTVEFSGTASDADDGALPPSAFTWEVVRHQGGQTTSVVAPFGGAAGGSFAVPMTADTAPDVFYRIHLRATDADGLTAEVTRDVLPRTATVTLATSVPGLALTLDGQPVSAPAGGVMVSGTMHDVAAPPSQTVDGVVYDFVSWSDGGAASHAIVVPDSDATYTAVYRVHGNPDSTVDLAPAVAGTLPPEVIGGRRGVAAVRLTNGGTGLLTGMVTVKVFLSDDETLDGSDALAGAATRRMVLKGGQARPVKVRLTYPALPDGTYRLLAQADADDAVSETDESNNVGVAAATILNHAPVIDLSGAFGKLPATLLRGRPGKVSVAVLNGGNVAAAGPLTLALLATQDPTGATGLTPLAGVTRPVKIAAGRRKTVKFAFIPPADLQPGAYYFVTQVDTASAFTETDEANNVAVSPGSSALG